MNMFCPKCGSILLPKKDKDKTILSCSCGYKNKDNADSTIKEAVTKESGKIEIVDKNYTSDILVDMECSKCKHGKAFFWTIQTRASDEPETKFFKCEKCSHTWRDYK